MRCRSSSAWTIAGAAIIAISTAGSNPSAQNAAMRPGNYEMRSEIVMGGRAMKLPPRTDAACVTADDLKDWSRTIVKSEGSTCTLTEYKPSGSKLTFVRECTGRNGARTTYRGDVTFTPPDTYRSVTTISGTSATNPLNGSTITTTAKRVGDCAK